MQGESESTLEGLSSPSSASRAPNSSGDSKRLGPFDPPADYAFEPEFSEEPPRTISERARQGRFEQNRKWALREMLAFGVFCLAVGELPLLKHWGKFVLPLAYLSWLGLAAIFFWAIGCLQRALAPGPYRYLTHGAALVARVVELVKAPAVIYNGEATHYGFTATIEFRDPQSGAIVYHRVTSPQFSAGSKNDYTTSFKVGDYVTAAYLPGKYPKSLQLAGFLDLIPGLGLVRRKPVVGQGDLWKVPFLLAAIVGFFGILAWNVYAFNVYQPIEFDFQLAMWPMIAGGATWTLLFLGGTWLQYRRQQQKIAERNAAALVAGEAIELGAESVWGRKGFQAIFLKLVLLVGCLLLGAATVLCWCFTANAWLDDSRSQLKPVAILGLKTKTHNHMFREYIIDYQLLGSAKPSEYSTTPDHLATFVNPVGFAELHAGRFGWPWVKALHPAPPGK